MFALLKGGNGLLFRPVVQIKLVTILPDEVYFAARPTELIHQVTDGNILQPEGVSLNQASYIWSAISISISTVQRIFRKGEYNGQES
jgi:hypothetical protein